MAGVVQVRASQGRRGRDTGSYVDRGERREVRAWAARAVKRPGRHDTNGVDPLPEDRDSLICSARGCRQPASYDLRWNNPKIHATDRRKHWLACDDHRESLMQYLSARGFLKETLPL
jgi:hypothetical protein